MYKPNGIWQQQFATGDGAAAANGDDDADNVVDYEAKIRQLMQQHEATTPALDFTQEMYYREVCQEMGVKIADAKKPANDDEDIEVVGNRSQSAGMSLKCPITTVLLEAPVKNKYCKLTCVFQRGHFESYTSKEPPMSCPGLSQSPIDQGSIRG